MDISNLPNYILFAEDIVNLRRYLYILRSWSLIRNKKQLFSLRDTAMQLRSQRPLHVQGVDGHPGLQGGGPKKKNRKKWRAQEEERHNGLLTRLKRNLYICK
jgi:hypothetical protein